MSIRRTNYQRMLIYDSYFTIHNRKDNDKVTYSHLEMTHYTEETLYT
jgi:hypothetical protein